MRLDKFHSLKELYNEYYSTFYSKGKGTVFDTAKGIWGPSGTQDVYELFVKIKLSKCKNFLDLGSGDGKVVLIASLFGVDSVGIEYDNGLVKKSIEFMKKLKLKAKFICGDYFKEDFSKYDIIFINPDQGFEKGLEDKLVKEMNPKCRLYVYNEIFQPRFLKKGKKYWFNGIPVIVYRKE